VFFEAVAATQLKAERYPHQFQVGVTPGTIQGIGTLRAIKQTEPQLYTWPGEADIAERAAWIQLGEIKPQSVHVNNNADKVTFISSRYCRAMAPPEDYEPPANKPYPHFVRKQVYGVTTKTTKLL